MSDLRLHPAESMALTIARGMASRGADITPNIAAFLVLILDRLRADPDAEDPRIAAAWGLVQEWTDQSGDALERAAALETTEYASIRRHVALRREAWTASHCAAELRRVLDGDTPGGAS